MSCINIGSRVALKASGMMVCVVPVHYVPGALSSIHVHTFELWRVIKNILYFRTAAGTETHTSCLFYACYKYARCIQDKENFLPQWSNQELLIKKCCIQSCKKAWRSNSILGVTGLEEILGEKEVAMRVD